MDSKDLSGLRPQAAQEAYNMANCYCIQRRSAGANPNDVIGEVLGRKPNYQADWDDAQYVVAQNWMTIRYGCKP